MGMLAILAVAGFFVVAGGVGAILWLFLRDDTHGDGE